MARLVPSDVKTLRVSGVHTPELDTLAALGRRLPSDCTVYHGVHWSTAFQHTTRYGEIDFVVVHEDGRIVVIEQKNGVLEETEEGVFKSYGGDQRKKVGDQIHRSIGAIRDKFARQHPDAGGLLINYLLYCPDYHLRGVHGAGLDRARVVDATRRDGLPQAIEALFRDAEERDLPNGELVHAFFRQTFDVVPDVAAHITANERAYTRLAGGLVEVVDQLSFRPWRLAVEGVAGCGKSLLAVHTFRRALNRGRRPLYVCYNRVLADRVSQQFDGLGGLVETFHGLCRLALEGVGVPVDFSRSGEPTFWDELVDAVLEHGVPGELRFDVAIVDEGQDFKPNWLEMLRLFLAEEHELLWLEDPHQNIRDTEAVDVGETVRYRARTSYRTPSRIASFIESTLAMPIQSGNQLPGLGVGVYGYDDPDRQVDLVQARINALRKLGFGNEDILVLTCAHWRHSAFWRLDRLAGVPLCRFTGAYDDDHLPVYTEGPLRLDSVGRFKGGQAPVVLLVEVEPDEARRAIWPRVLFAGMTRATVRLELIVDDRVAENAVFRDAADAT